MEMAEIKIEVQCVGCGKFFQRPLHSRAKICSLECRRKQQRKWHAKWLNKHGRHGFTSKIHIRKCVECGKPFEAKFYNSIVCSAECKHDRIISLNRKYRKIKQLQRVRKCRYCQRSFTPADGRQYCCSPTCSWLRKQEISSQGRKRRRITYKELACISPSILRPFHGHCDWSIGEEIRILRLAEKLKNEEKTKIASR